MDSEKVYPVLISSGLLASKHYEKIGTAVWEFMWLLQRVTKLNDSFGLVYGGKPIKINEIARQFGIHRNQVQRHIEILKKNDYISTTRTPYGLIIYVKKIKKRYTDFGIGVIPKKVHGCTEKGVSKEDSSKDIVIDIHSPSGEPATADKSMLTRNENDFSDSNTPEIDADGDGKVKVAEKTANQNKAFGKFVEYFQAAAREKLGTEIEISFSKDKPSFHKMKKLYTSRQIADIVNFFFTLPKSKEHPSITACFSADTRNQWRLKGDKSLR